VTDLSYPSLFMQGFYWLERHPAPLLGRAHLRPGCKVSHLHCAEADCVNGARAHMALPQHLRCRANSAPRNAICRINTYGVAVGLRPVQQGGSY
jgi:hypothetical protein